MNIFISNDLNVFSFDFKNIKEENIEDDDSIDIINTSSDRINEEVNFSSKNMFINNGKENSYKKLKFIFVANITNKFAIYLRAVLRKIYLFNFIKLFMQKINKIINQYVYYYICDKKKEKNEIIFFSVLKRHIKYNLNNNNNKNEIWKLLIENIPKSFQNSDDYGESINIPYIARIQEKNLVNTQLFINKDNKMINYINNFFNNEKGTFLLNNNLLKRVLNKIKLKNRNIFTITNYFDDINELIIHNKLCKRCLCLSENCKCKNVIKQPKYNYIKKKCNHISMIKKQKKEKEENINDEYFNMMDDEEINVDEFDENNNYNFSNTLNNSSNNIGSQIFNNILTYHNENTQNHYEYKFFDYINEKCKKNKYNETLPVTKRSEIHSCRINKYI